MKLVGIALRALLALLLLELLVNFADSLDGTTSWVNWPIREALAIVAWSVVSVALIRLLVRYARLLLRFLLTPLRFLLSRLRLRAPRVRALTELNQLDGHAFETWLVDCFNRAGFQCDHVGQHGQDLGADVIVRKAGRSAVIQAKRWRGSVGSKVVSDVYAAKDHYGCDEAWIITTSRFTPRAREFAASLGVRLYGMQALEKWKGRGWPTAVVPPPFDDEALLKKDRVGHGRALVR